MFEVQVNKPWTGDCLWAVAYGLLAIIRTGQLSIWATGMIADN